MSARNFKRCGANRATTITTSRLELTVVQVTKRVMREMDHNARPNASNCPVECAAAHVTCTPLWRIILLLCLSLGRSKINVHCKVFVVCFYREPHFVISNESAPFIMPLFIGSNSCYVI